MAPRTDVWWAGQYGQTQFGSVSGGGGEPPEPWWRDLLDTRRSMYRRTPDAEYPDGYLGTIQSRREDRLLDSLKVRVTQRSYQRGVHKGERIDPADYLWPAEFGPDTSLKLEAQGRRFSPIPVPSRGQPQEWQMLPRGSQSLMQLTHPERLAEMQRLAPPWR